ncbi:ribosomal RNA processing protein 1 homolog B isoform X3 [Sagmatias obliquidens]|uniref:ribosomal RNA processing protein 1 homolog B isoform X3 n=1 Tax=Sagmatias obliquidens TaxID=3371155 RepID=UPI000F442C11|nr:ribosomal RNA processing protein 1 homolog B isoform X3 [Lagenorhynchus obliquidens]
MAPAMQPAEIQFAQRLASHEKGIRDRAVKKLRQYISVKTQRETGGFSQEELLKIWKGLFYCLWVQDEPLLQEELANTISQLIHVVNSSEAQHLFIQTFWQTVNREWPDIDGLRLDKYHMLIRLVLRQSFEVLKRNGWEESRIKLFLDVLMKEILHPESQSPNGVKFHFIDIYLDELSKVGGKELLADQNLKFIDPFCKVAAKTKDQTLVQTIARGVFEVIVDQSPFAPEETVEEQKTKVGDSDLSEEETSGNEMTWRKAISRKKTALGRYHCRKEGVAEEGGRGGGGGVEDAGLLLQFDYKAVADRLLEITNRKNIPPFNRKRLSKLIKKFQDLSEAGSISHLSFAEDASADEDDQSLSQGRHKKKGNKLLEKTDMERGKGAKFSPAEEEESAGSVPKRKRKKKKKNHLRPEHLRPGGEATCPEQNGSRQPEAGPGRAQEASAAELGTVATSWPREQSGSEPASVHSRRRRLRKRSLRVQVESPEAAALAGGAPVLKRTRELGALLVNGGGPPTLAWPLPPPASPADRGDCPATLPQGGKLKKRRRESGGHDLHDLSAQKAAVLKKRKKVKEMSKWAEHRGVKLVQALVRRPGPGQGAGAPGRECQGPTCSAACMGRTGDSQPRAQGAVMAPDNLYQGASSDPLGGFLCVPPAPTPLAPQRPGRGRPQSGELSLWPVPADKQAGVCLQHTLISFFFFYSWPVLANAGAPDSLISLMFLSTWISRATYRRGPGL